MTQPPTDPVPDATHELSRLYQRPNLTWRTPNSAPQYEEWLNLLASLYAAGAPSITAPHAYHFTGHSDPALTPDEWTHLHQPAAEAAPYQELFVSTLCIALPTDLQQRTAVLVEVARSGPRAVTLSPDRRYVTISWA